MFAFQRDGSVLRDKRTALPMLRPKGVPTPCGSCQKVPESLRKAGLNARECRRHAVEFTPQNRAAWQFYRECRAVGKFPDDPLVRWYASVIRETEDRLDRMPTQQLAGAVGALAAILTQRRR